MSDSVGKITLDLEVTSDIAGQVKEVSSTIANTLKSSLSSSTNKVFDNIDKSMKSSLSKVNSNMKSMMSNVTSNLKNSLSKAFSMLSNIKIPTVKFNTINTENTGSSNVENRNVTRGPPVDRDYLTLQRDNKWEMLQNLQYQIEANQNKLKEFREAYDLALNPKKKAKINDQILKTENAIIRLTSKSDKLGFELHELDNKLEAVGKESSSTGNKINSLNSSFNKLNTNSSKSGGVFSRITNSLKNLTSGLNTSSRSTRSFNNGILGSIGQMAKWMIFFPMIVNGIYAMSSSLFASLNTNAQFVNSLNQIKTNLMVAFTPIFYAILPAINTLMSALATVTQYIASFISAIFGKTYNQSYKATQSLINAKDAMGAYGNAAESAGNSVEETGKKAQKALGDLMGFDEINKLNMNDNSDTSSPSTGGAGGSGAPILSQPLLDTSLVDKQMSDLVNKIKDIMSKIFEPFVNAWNKEGQNTINAIKYALNGIWELIKAIGTSFLKVWTNGSGERILILLLQILQNIFNIVGDIANTFAIAWKENEIGTKIIQGVANVIENLLTIIKKVGDAFREAWGVIGEPLAKAFLKVIELTIGILENLSEKLIYVWDNGGSHLFEGLIKLGAKILELASYIYTEFVAPFVDWFVNMMAPAIAPVLDILGSLFDKFSELIDCLLNDGKPVLDAITFSVTTFFAAWKLTELLAFIQMSGGIVGAFKTITNAIKACTVAKLTDKLETIYLTALYAKDFIISLANGTTALIKQAAQWTINTGLKIADTAAQIAMTAATVAWNAICGLATIATTAFGVAIAFLTSPIGLVIIAITSLIAIGVLLYKNWDTVKAKSIEVWSNVKDTVRNVCDSCKDKINQFKENVSNSWNSIKNKFDEFKTWLGSVFATDWSNKFGGFGDILNGFLSNVRNIFNSVKQIFGGIIDFISGVFTGNWRKAWNGVVDIFGGIMSGLKSVTRSPLNAVISLVNAAISGLNKISVKIPDFVPGYGGKSFGINIPKIPYLAKGGIIDSPTLAMVGEAGKEAVVPLENNTGGLDILAEKLSSRMASGSSGTSPIGDITIQIGNDTLAKILLSELKRIQRQTGQAIINV